jgi:ABC-type uncharacterized transport system substrate-binding protein
LRKLASAALAAAMLTMPASADVTQNDMLVAGRVIGFIDSLKRGDVRVGIVYDPNVAQSSQQAAELNTLMSNGLRIGSLTLRPVLLPIAKLGNGDAGLFFLTEGLGTQAAGVGRASRDHKIPCITFDLSQVRNGICAIGVRAQPRIDVIVNRAAAEASGTVLAAVFRIMITEI